MIMVTGAIRVNRLPDASLHMHAEGCRKGVQEARSLGRDGLWPSPSRGPLSAYATEMYGDIAAEEHVRDTAAWRAYAWDMLMLESTVCPCAHRMGALGRS